MGVRENSSGGNNHYFKVSGSGLLSISHQENQRKVSEAYKREDRAASLRVFWNGIEGYLSDINKRSGVQWNKRQILLSIKK